MPFEDINRNESPEAAKESKDYLKQAESLIPDRFKVAYHEMKALVDDGEKRKILERQAGNPQKAMEVASYAVEKKDAELLNNYVSSLEERNANSMGTDAQIALLKAADEINKGKTDLRNPNITSRDFDETVATYREIGKKLPYAHDPLVAEHEEKLESGYYDRKIPANVAALPRHYQAQIYKMNPEGFAKSFPDSDLVQEDAIQELVETDKISLSKTAMDIPYSYVGRNASLLNNPNLSEKQLAQITDAFVQIGYDPNPERNPDYFEATQNVLRVYNGIKHHPNTSPATKKKLQDRFDKSLKMA